jgi:small subunit ribosomal protein S1
MYAVGDSLTAKVMHINSEERRIGLSIKRLESDDDQSYLEEYVTKMKAAPASFGEILKENLQEKLNGQAKKAELKSEATAQSPDNQSNSGE